MRAYKGDFRLDYSWRRSKPGAHVLDRHRGYLDDEAWVAAKQQMGVGRSSGELKINIKVEPKDGPDGVSYVGSWSIEKPAEAVARGED